MTTQYNNLFARYLFTSQDNNVVWEKFNTTYGWMSDTPPTWVAKSGGIRRLGGALEFASDEQYVELSPRAGGFAESDDSALDALGRHGRREPEDLGVLPRRRQLHVLAADVGRGRRRSS